MRWRMVGDELFPLKWLAETPVIAFVYRWSMQIGVDYAMVPVVPVLQTVSMELWPWYSSFIATDGRRDIWDKLVNPTSRN